MLAQPSEKKKDNKQILLDLIGQRYGLSNAVVMEKAFKTQDKQVEEAMTQGGLTADEIGKSKNIDLNLINKLVQNPNSESATSQNQQFLPAKGIMSPAQQLPSGQIQEGGALSWIGRQSTSDLLKRMLVMSKIQGQQMLTPESQIKTLTKTQDILKNLGIKAKVDVTATGVPTLSTQPELGLSDLPTDQQLQAVALARKVAGVRGADRIIPTISEGLKSGKTIDAIEDELRLSGQSSEFTGSLRSAAQQVMVGKSANDQQTAFDTLDDLQSQPDQQMEYLKRMAIVNAPIDQRQTVMGKERTIDLLNEIGGDLDTLEKNGFPTGFFSGNYENLLARVGQVRSPEMRKVATKVSVAVINYRRAMTGVQFGQIENREYKVLFPNINKIGTFNKSAIEGLKEVFGGDVNKFYQQSMGKKNYDKLSGGLEQTQEQQNSTDEYEQMLQILQGGK